MKKIYLSIITTLAAFSVSAQLTDANHSPVAGDMFSAYQCDSTSISAGASGAGATWNYAAIATRSSIVNNYTAAVNSNASYPQPGVAVASALSNMSYYKSSAASLVAIFPTMTSNFGNSFFIFFNISMTPFE